MDYLFIGDTMQNPCLDNDALRKFIDGIVDKSQVEGLFAEYVDKENYNTTCLYLTSLATTCSKPELILDIVWSMYMKFENYSRALQLAFRLDNMKYVKLVLMSCTALQRLLYCFIIARHGMLFELDNEIVADDKERGKLQEIINNIKQREVNLTLARNLEVVLEPRSLEDIYNPY